MAGDGQHPEDFGIGRLFYLTSEAIIGADLAEGRIVLWNPAAVELLGYSTEEAVGMPLRRLVPEELSEQHLAGVRRYREGGEAVLVGAGRVVVPAVTKSGERRDVALTLTDVSTDGRRVVLAILRDVSAQLKAERELAAANQTMREFVASASHDLRTPLTTVIGFAHLLVDHGRELDDERQRSSLVTIVRAAEAAARLVEDLLTISQIQAGVVIPRPQLVDVAETIGEVAKQFDFPVALESRGAMSVFADPDHVRRMSDNYLSNAGRYGQPPIVVRTSTKGSFVEVRVCDSGPGVPDFFISRLFTSFARADTDRADSTGLGLSIVKGLAEVNGGSAFYERNDVTTCFGFSLPLASKS